MGDEAENLIQQMKDKTLTPGIIHYTSALNAWAKSADRNSLRRAETLFRTMEEKFPDLDRAAYHGLLLNYSTRGNSNDAERLLRRILDAGHRPNRATFTMVIDSHARSGSADAGRKAEELLDRMRELHAAGNDEVEVCSPDSIYCGTWNVSSISHIYYLHLPVIQHQPDDVTYASVIRCRQVSKNRQVRDLTRFEKLQLMRDLQLETWPFGNNIQE